MKPIRIAVIISMAIATLLLAGCPTISVLRQPSSDSRTIDKGETGVITGRLDKIKNAYMLTEAQTGIVYRFVGLGKDGERQLAPYVGRTVSVKLVVKSVESAKARNAQLVEIVR
ncbi:MAG: hypothetical protein A2177_05050 [Spirochaetes bacterium RBG_13_68_11]|nr:MAG: hypothetical protein A2177_05050 [Spirochaetes bacterium RBG_13_68_11]